MRLEKVKNTTIWGWSMNRSCGGYAPVPGDGWNSFKHSLNRWACRSSIPEGGTTIMSERVEYLRMKAAEAVSYICAERGRIVTEVLPRDRRRSAGDSQEPSPCGISWRI